MYKEYLYVFLIVIIHELGHAYVAKLFNWHIEKIEVYPFGGCVKFNEDINRPSYEELLILLAGPIIQMLTFVIVLILYKNDLLSLRNYLIFKEYNYSLLIFNLMPIYPLDGGRLFNILMNYLLPYKKGNKLVILISFIIMLFLIFYFKNVNFLFMSFIILLEIYLYYKRQDYLYNKFLLERYLNKYHFKKYKIIKDKINMYKEKRHILKNNDYYLTEKDYLNDRFKRRKL